MSLDPPTDEPEKPMTWRQKCAASSYLLAVTAVAAGVVWLMSPFLEPLHGAVIARMGWGIGLTLQAALWAFIVLIWTQVPAMPGLMQGVICIVGWLYIGTGVLGWLAFAAGTSCGISGY